MKIVITTLMVLVLNSFELISEEILFKKTIDDNSYLIVTTRIAETNIIKSVTRSGKNEVLTWEYSIARFLYIKMPETTNALHEFKYMSKSDPSTKFAGDVDIAKLFWPIKIFDVFYNSTNGDYAILWLCPYDYVSCIVNKRSTNNMEGYQFEQFQYYMFHMLKSSKVDLRSYANGGKILYNPENGQFKVVVNTIKGIDAMFEWENNKWVEVEK